MHMEEHQPGFAAKGSAGLGNDAPFIEGVELFRVRVTACLSVSTVLSVLHVQEITRKNRRVFKCFGGERGEFPDRANVFHK